MRKRWLPLLVLMSLAVPALPQTIDGQQHRELSDAYDAFFGVTWSLMQLDAENLDHTAFRLGHVATPQPEPKHADNWLMERNFSPSDTKRIENTVSQWYTDRIVVFAWKTAPRYNPFCLN